MYQADWKKYFYVFLITLAIFGTAFYTSTQLNNKKIAELQTIQNRMAIDVSASEMQFNLLAEASCENATSTSLSNDMDTLGSKLSYAETNITTNADDVTWLQKEYSLLEIKNYLLTKQIAKKCGLQPATILYFYSNKHGSCPDCRKEGLVLTELRRNYPGVRVYSFDYDLDLSALDTIESIHKINGDLPALVINGETYTGFQSTDAIKSLIPNLEELAGPNTTATPNATNTSKK